jgi:hypothetical protein
MGNIAPESKGRGHGTAIAACFMLLMLSTVALAGYSKMMGDELNKVKVTLNDTRHSLNWTAMELNLSKQSLSLKSGQLNYTTAELDQKNLALQETNQQLSIARRDLEQKEYALQVTSIRVNVTTEMLSQKSYTLNQTAQLLEQKNDTIQLMISQANGSLINFTQLLADYAELDAELNYSMRYNVHDPTYAEFISFCQNDTTEFHDYEYPNYVCMNFAADFKANATKAGIRCAYVGINFVTLGHAINAVNTTDHGMIFIDQTNYDDAEVSPPVVGLSWMFISEPVEDLVIVW